MMLFDKWSSERAKVDGMAIAAEARPSDLETARRVAMELVRIHGTTNADEVGKVLHERYGIKTLGPAAGSIFSEEHWQFTGERIVSERKTNHGREIKVWRLKSSSSAPASA